MTTNSSVAVAETLRAVLEHTGRRGDDVTITLEGTELTGPASVVRHKLAAVLYDILHARHGMPASTRRRPQWSDEALAPKPANGSRMELALLQEFADRTFVVRRPLVEERADSVVYLQNGGSRADHTGQGCPFPRIRGRHPAPAPFERRLAGLLLCLRTFLPRREPVPGEGNPCLPVHRRPGRGGTTVRGRRAVPRRVGGIDFDVKLLTCPADYPRSDSMVLYVDQDPDEICDAVHAWSTEHRDHFVAGSLLTRQCHPPGISTAQEPPVNFDDPTLRNLSFGQHRSLMIADAVIEFATTGGTLDAALERSALVFGVHPHDYSSNLPVEARC